MAVDGKIHWDEGSMREDGKSADTFLHYYVWSDDPANDDRGTAFSWVRDNAPDILFGLYKEEISLKERLADDTEKAIWDCSVKYVNLERKKPKEIEVKEPEDGPQDVRLSIRSGTGGTLKRTSSEELLQEVYHYEGGRTSWNWKDDPKVARLLNLEADSKENSASMFVAKGISVPVGTVEIVAETVIPDSQVRLGRLIDIALLAGKNVVNNPAWRGFDIRSLKFISFDSSQRAGDEADTDANTSPWTVTYVFAYAPTIKAEDIEIAPGLTPFDPFTQDKYGWDYMDVLYVNSEHELSTIPGVKFVLPQGRRQTIHRIYEEADFAQDLRI